jgi:hypothetical protein
MSDPAGSRVGEWLAARAGLLSSLKDARRGLDDDWWRRQRRGVASEPSLRLNFASQVGASSRSEPHLDMRQRFERLAGGAQPVVTKVLAFGGGSTTARVASYISRDGQIPLENEFGVDFEGRQVAVNTAKEWAPLFSGGERSRDVALFECGYTTERSSPNPIEVGLSGLNQAFGGRPFAVAVIEKDNEMYFEGLVVLNLSGKGRLEPDENGQGKTESRLRHTLPSDVHDIAFQFGRHGHGTRFAGSELRKLVEKHPGHVFDEQGLVIDTVRDANRLVQRDWRSKLESRGPRDHMHLLISAPSEAPAVQFEAAVRQFLSQEFGGHRYLFAIHDPAHDPKSQSDGGKRPHLHAHALISTRSKYGDRLRVWVTDLNQWRVSFAQCARDQGIAIEVTHRHETLQAPAYRHKDVRPVSFVGRTKHVGTSISAQQRYDAKRSERPHIDHSEWAKNQAQLTRQIWQEVANQSRSAKGQAFAEDMVARFDEISRDGPQRQKHQNFLPSSLVTTDRLAVPPQMEAGRIADDVAETQSKCEENGMAKHERATRSSEGANEKVEPARVVEALQEGGSQHSSRWGLFAAMGNMSKTAEKQGIERRQADRKPDTPSSDRRLDGGDGSMPGSANQRTGLAGQTYEHVDLSKLPRHPTPDPLIEAAECAVFLRQEYERAEKDARTRTQEERPDAGQSRKGRDDDRIHDR